jgi:hypothetical protein
LNEHEPRSNEARFEGVCSSEAGRMIAWQTVEKRSSSIRLSDALTDAKKTGESALARYAERYLSPEHRDGRTFRHNLSHQMKMRIGYL